ncbi:MAG: hypothetical protein JNM34_07715 [Chthonomonadaceae bacterium]|nr:hypothetical protein [Chthonomonadaceae bacterium]
MESFLSLATLLGLGGVVGALTTLYVAGKRFGTHLSELASSIEAVLRDPRKADLKLVVEKARQVEQDAKSMSGLLRQLFGR